MGRAVVVATTLVALLASAPVAAQSDEGGGAATEGSGDEQASAPSGAPVDTPPVDTQPDKTVPDATVPDASVPDDTTPATTDPQHASSSATVPDATLPGQAAAAAAADAGGSSTQQSAIASVTGTAIAVATTGDNSIDTTVTGSPPASGGGSDPAEVRTGPADATGSRDRTKVVQEADAILSGDATADIVQVVLVFNIGAALANSGMNAVSAPGGAAAEITTGSAVAIGNDSAAYLTQASAADATDGGTHSASQLTVNLRLGIAIADSGFNAITITGVGGGGGGTIEAGAASATGNESVTEIAQRAVATGSGTSRLTIDQRALVINLGLALANTGANEVRGLAGSLLTTPDEAIAQQLFELLLPALLASVAADAPGGGGTITSGDATAIGNRSATYIDQTASAVAAGDGSASVSQGIVVANIGAAVANTGGNDLGAAGRSQLDDRSIQVAADLARAFADLLAQLNRWSYVPGASPINLGLTVPLGDLLIGMDTTIGGNEIALAGADATTGPRARLRQLTAVVNLGIARANTGSNTTVVVETATGDVATLGAARTSLGQGDAQAAGVTSIRTGDARAVNSSLVVICLLGDSPDHPCLAPPSPVPGGPTEQPVAPDGSRGAAPTPVTGGPTPFSPTTPTRVVQRPTARPSTRRELPATGTDIELLLVTGTALVAIGGVLTRVRRRPAQ